MKPEGLWSDIWGSLHRTQPWHLKTIIVTRDEKYLRKSDIISGSQWKTENLSRKVMVSGNRDELTIKNLFEPYQN